MTLAVRADLEAVRGPRYVEELLVDAADPADDTPTQDAQKQARLDEALQAGDDLIAQFLDLGKVSGDEVAERTLKRLAIDESLYYLQRHSRTGATEGADEQARTRRVDLAHMRDKQQWPGTAKGQHSINAAYVEPASSFASTKLTGLT